MKIYHNPRCRKSRETLELLKNEGHQPEIVEYLKDPPTAEELKAILEKLQMPAHALVRRNEEIYLQYYKGKTLTEEQWIEVLTKEPKLMERPIVVYGNKAVLGRPPENIYAII